MNSDKQTLILAGETVPVTNSTSESALPAIASRTHRLTIVATRAEPILLAQGEYAQYLGALVAKTHYPASNHGSSFNAANEYARTQDLPGFGGRRPIIDTYA